MCWYVHWTRPISKLHNYMPCFWRDAGWRMALTPLSWQDNHSYSQDTTNYAQATNEKPYQNGIIANVASGICMSRILIINTFTKPTPIATDPRTLLGTTNHSPHFVSAYIDSKTNEESASVILLSWSRQHNQTSCASPSELLSCFCSRCMPQPCRKKTNGCAHNIGYFKVPLNVYCKHS